MSEGKTKQRAEKLPTISEFLQYHAAMGRRFPVSELCNESFPSTFNASGFHADILGLQRGDRGHGVDNCIRHLDVADPDVDHKALFLMGIFARCMERETDGRGNFTDPSIHPQFFEFQRSIIDQFFHFLDSMGINRAEVSATVFAGGPAGGHYGMSGARDGALERTYQLGADTGGISALRDYIGAERIFPVRSLINIDIRPEEGALVGPRIEVAVRGFEIATVVFDYYKIGNRKLIPIDYIGGYAVGMERMLAAQTAGGNLYNTGVMVDAKRILDTYVHPMAGFPPITDSPLMSSSVRRLLSSVEALAHATRAYDDAVSSKSRRSIVAALRENIRSSAKELGMEDRDVAGFVMEFSSLVRGSLPAPFDEVHHDVSLAVLDVA